MRLFINPIILLMILILNFETFNQKNKNKVKKNNAILEKAYKNCSKNDCSERKHDESCIFSCISLKCYKSTYEKENYILEFGEVDFDKKSEFEKCYKSIDKKK
jgi:hypothetical protein